MEKHHHQSSAPAFKSDSLRLIATWLACFLLALTSLLQAETSVRDRIKIRKKTQITRTSQDNSEEFNLQRMELVASKRRNLMLDIRRFLREAKAEDQKSELNLRLGALYMEDYHGNLAKAQTVYDNASAEYKKNPKKFRKAPKLDTAEASASLDKARAIYKDLIQRYPKHARRDEMFYFLAISSLDKGRTEEAMTYFQQLTEQTPNSKYGNDALVQLGDHYFETNRFAVAEKYYDRLITKKYRPLMPYSYYKKAWCAYNMRRTEESLKYFKWVVQNEEAEESGAPVKIRGEALKDITLPFVDLRLADQSIAFFRAVGDPYYRRGIETMAQLYQEAGEYRYSIAMYELLLALDPNYAKNPTYEVAIVDALKLKNEQEASVNRLFNRLPNYLENSNWYEINASSPQTIQEAARLFEEVARKYAFLYHAEGQKTKNDHLYTMARQLYSKYIEYFPRTPQASQVRFYLAEIQYKQSQFVPAADNYYLVYKDPGAGNLRQDGIHFALLALDRQLNIDRKKAGLTELNTKLTSKLKEKEDSLELVPMSDVETKFVEIATEYLDKFPSNKDAPDVLYESSYLYYSHHDLNRAVKGFWILVQKYPKHETAIPSANLILDVLNRKKDYPKLIAACQKFLSLSELSKPAFRTEVADVLRHAELKRIQLIEDKGEYKLAGDNYVEYTKAYGAQDEQLFEKALYNASVDYSKASLYLAAVETQEKFLRRFPKSSLRENMYLQVAKTYETLANFEKAGVYFEQFSTLYPKNPQAKNALRLAGLYHWGSGNGHRAEVVMLGFLKSYPSDAKMVEKDLLNLYESQGATDKMISYYLKARAERGVPFSEYVADSIRISELYAQKSGQMPVKVLEEAFRVCQKYPKEVASSPRGVEAMSKLYFYFANRREEGFRRLKLTYPEGQLEANLQRKLALLKELEKEYAAVMKLGSGEWGLAAIYKTAALYRHLAQEVQAAPVPAELTGEQIETYRAEISKQMIKPFNERAQNLAAQCLDKSQEFNLLSSWTPRCYSLATELEPSQYPMVRTFYLPSWQLALMIPPRDTSKIALGGLKNYSYPYYSAGLFQPLPERQLANDIPSLYVSDRQNSELPGIVPTPVNYRVLSEDRNKVLRQAYESEKPSDLKHGASFAFLNLMRLLTAQRAVPSILEAIQKDPNNSALHNLLGLTYFELGNLPAAKVTWLSLVARGVKASAIWNNLGVIASLEGNEMAAIDFFQEASTMEGAKEAASNLGFIALKYRNGFEAKKHF